ncbi:hypothetical protein H4CHR_04409 [Variovorax sp. PBS-H4]|uniref:hypothetical protein n=1 Tax=Variovorax sp. PBS-H4 TaxID=434008 RepID=UPI001319426D|nr:hypothetical protein [Variovorax sp. PBS-H4]VTU38373.1 hypothetical protein H4CHR_04409 [Variovorax sp. PBS-H4]
MTGGALIPCAPAPDPVAHRVATAAHLLRMARLDAGYARWRADQMAREDPGLFADLLAQLDAELTKARISYPAPFIEPASRLPKLARGPRAFPKHRFFHDTL